MPSIETAPVPNANTDEQLMSSVGTILVPSPYTELQLVPGIQIRNLLSIYCGPGHKVIECIACQRRNKFIWESVLSAEDETDSDSTSIESTGDELGSKYKPGRLLGDTAFELSEYQKLKPLLDSWTRYRDFYKKKPIEKTVGVYDIPPKEWKPKAAKPIESAVEGQKSASGEIKSAVFPRSQRYDNLLEIPQTRKNDESDSAIDVNSLMDNSSADVSDKTETIEKPDIPRTPAASLKEPSRLEDEGKATEIQEKMDIPQQGDKRDSSVFNSDADSAFENLEVKKVEKYTRAPSPRRVNVIRRKPVPTSADLRVGEGKIERPEIPGTSAVSLEESSTLEDDSETPEKMEKGRFPLQEEKRDSSVYNSQDAEIALVDNFPAKEVGYTRAPSPRLLNVIRRKPVPASTDLRVGGEEIEMPEISGTSAVSLKESSRQEDESETPKSVGEEEFALHGDSAYSSDADIAGDELTKEVDYTKAPYSTPTNQIKRKPVPPPLINPLVDEEADASPKAEAKIDEVHFPAGDEPKDGSSEQEQGVEHGNDTSAIVGDQETDMLSGSDENKNTTEIGKP